MIQQIEIDHMKTKLIAIAFLSLFVLNTKVSNAQKGNNQLGIIAEAGFPNDSDMGYGGFIKGAYGVKGNAQITLQVGVSKFKSNIRSFDMNGNELDRATTRLIPILIGYKQYLKQFYLEPQVGFGELGGKIDIGGDWSRPSNGAFYWAAGAGYQFNKVDLGIRYQSAHATGGKNGGIWGDKAFSFVGVHVGYTFTL